MDVRDYVADAIARTRAGTLDLVRDLTSEQLTWQIAPEANTVGFLLFHIFRVEDYFLRVLGAEHELWRQEGWAQRWTPTRTSRRCDRDLVHGQQLDA